MIGQAAEIMGLFCRAGPRLVKRPGGTNRHPVAVDWQKHLKMTTPRLKWPSTGIVFCPMKKPYASFLGSASDIQYWCLFEAAANWLPTDLSTETVELLVALQHIPGEPETLL